MKKVFKRLMKLIMVFLLVLVFAFSNFVSYLPLAWQNNKLAEGLKVKEAMAAAPTYVGKGAFTSGVGALTVPVPAGYADNDIFLLFVESANEAIATPTGWTQAANSPQFTGTAAAAGGVRLAVFYKIVSGAQSSVSVADSGNHTTAIIAAFRGVDTAAPIHLTAGSVDASATSAISTPSVTTSITDTMIVNAIGLDKDAADTDTITTAPTNANLTNLAERHDQTVSSGVGGGLAFFTGEKATAGAVGNTTATADSATTHAYLTIALKPVPLTLTISQTAGSKVATKNSGDADQYSHDTACAGAATCAAFTLAASGGTVNVTSIKITESGTATANTELSDLNLYYDTDGNWSDAGAETLFGTAATFAADQTATISGTLAISAGATAYIYVRYDLANGTTYPQGGATVNFQIAAAGDVVSDGTESGSGTLAGTTTILPKISSVSYGSGLSDGARSSEAITVSGYGFGVVPGGSRANCAGAVDTGCVRFLVGGAATVADVSVSSWSNTSIGLTVSSTLATLGGASSLEVVSGSQSTATDTTYYIYPNITAVTTISINAGREYDSGDVDGLVMLSGDHFGSVQGAVAFTGAFGGGGATVHATAEGSCATGGWSASGYSGNSACIEVTSSSIPDSVYSGTITLTRNSDSKTHTANPTFYIMPRIISNTSDNGVIGDRIKIAGNHFCQSGTCPVSPNRSDTSNNVKFGSTQALDSDFVNSGASPCSGNAEAWTNTEICVKVPVGTPVGSQPTKVRTNATYDSNTKAFTVNSTVPNDPTVTEPPSRQWNSAETAAIAVGGLTSSSTVVLKADISVGVTSNLRLQIEVQSISTAFTCTGSNPIGSGGCTAYSGGAGVLEGTVVGGGGCDACTSLSQAKISFTGLTDGAKHWRARVRNASTGEYSNWVSFGANPESSTDFEIDTTAPTIYFLPGQQSGICSDSQSNPTANSIKITWYISESANGQVEYSASSDLSGSANYPIPPSATSTSHAITLSNLNSNTTYYYKVKSQDNAGNLANRPTAQPYCQFTTYSVTQPAKTTIFYATSTPGVISGGNTSTSTFSVYVSEATSTVLIKSAFLEITGLVSGGTNPIDIKVNDVAIKSYSINATNPTHFKFIYQIPIPDPLPETRLNLNDITPCTNGNPSGTAPCNKLVITTGAGMSINIASSKIIITYAYSP